MTDLEITRLCAEAMGLAWSRPKFQTHSQVWVTDGPYTDKWKLYDPFHDGAQAMALVNKFKPLIDFTHKRGYVSVWLGEARTKEGNYQEPTVLPDSGLNRAVCECVAKMQQERTK